MNHSFVTILPQTFPGASGQMDVKMLLQPNGPVVWGVAVCVRVGMRFCKVPIGGRAFGVTLKLSRWRGPDKWAGFVTS
jgi:hypothetical protein